MPLPQDHVSSGTPLGANVVRGQGATFRTWAERARAVHLLGDLGGRSDWTPSEANRLVRQDGGYWAGFSPGARDGDRYIFFVVGEGSSRRKRDPYARELTKIPAYPNCNCVLRAADTYPWRSRDWRAPAFSDLIIYELHVGTFSGSDLRRRTGTFLDVLSRLSHLKHLGVNAVELLPIGEYATPRGSGYDGSDLFSHEMDYGLDGSELGPYLARVNDAMRATGRPELRFEDLVPPGNQLKAMVDLLHLNGIAVILDVVHNHAGFQIDGQEESLWFYDCRAGGNPNDSQFFTEQKHVGGPVFAFGRQGVKQYLIDNAAYLLREFRVDGLRHDRVDVIIEMGGQAGITYCRDMMNTVHFAVPSAIQIAEKWPPDPWVARPTAEGGAGFDATWHNGLRYALRGALEAASNGRDAPVDLGAVAWALDPVRSHGFGAPWRAVQCLESHDEAHKDKGPKARIAALAGGGHGRSWYAQSRARVASGILLTAPGIPMLFMGQEFLEDKPWTDDPAAGGQIWWEGAEGRDRAMADFLHFFRDLVWLRRRHPALRGDRVNAYHINGPDRILAFHRWIEGTGRDVVVVASLREETLRGYRLGMPRGGRWQEEFNSDAYQGWPNPSTAGNGGEVWADGEGMHGLPSSAVLTIPANAVLVLTTDGGDF
jgi:1,4-alpha-glucan branching enzyme